MFWSLLVAVTVGSSSLQVREFIRKAGNLKGEKWRLFDHTPTEKTYKSLKQAVAAGFTPPDPKDVD
jgi:hypothetical protein